MTADARVGHNLPAEAAGRQSKDPSPFSSDRTLPGAACHFKTRGTLAAADARHGRLNATAPPTSGELPYIDETRAQPNARSRAHGRDDQPPKLFRREPSPSTSSTVSNTKEVAIVEQFVEYREAPSSHPLRQGDILEATDEDAEQWARHLCVLTADCDFAHGKHTGRVTCVPILTAEEYLMEFQIPKLRDRLAKTPLQLIKAACKSAAPNVSEHRLRQWPQEQATAEIVRSLRLDDTRVREVELAIEALRLIDTPAGSLREAVRHLIGAQLSTAAPPLPDRAAHTVTQVLHDTYRNPPGDALFISAIAPTLRGGYFIYLRHLEQVWQPTIALGPSDTAYRKLKYRRISKFDDRFCHAIVQRFAMVFLPIGLPYEYEEIRDLHATAMKESLS